MAGTTFFLQGGLNLFLPAFVTDMLLTEVVRNDSAARDPEKSFEAVD
jgi:hypothetical protein